MRFDYLLLHLLQDVQFFLDQLRRIISDWRQLAFSNLSLLFAVEDVLLEHCDFVAIPYERFD